MFSFAAWIAQPSTKIGLAALFTTAGGYVEGKLTLGMAVTAAVSALVPIIINDPAPVAPAEKAN